MREDTPPTSPSSYDISAEDFVEDDELIYVGDADEVLDDLEQHIGGGGGGSEEEDDDDDDEELCTAGGVEGTGNATEPLRDDALITFAKHTAPVFCGHFHPTENVVVTGGEDDRAFVWSSETGDVVFECTGHKDTVIAAEFSYDGNYLATGDIAGEIQVFKVSQSYKRVWDFSMGDMAWMRWHKAANVLMAGAESGEVYVWRIPSGDCKVLQGQGAKSECGRLTKDGKRLVVGYSDGAVRVWDIRTNTVAQEVVSTSTYGHTENVISVDTDCDNQLVLSGSVDGQITITGPTGPVGNLYPSGINDNDSIEAISFAPAHDDALKLAASGTIKGKITIWDVPRQTVRCECKDDLGGGVTAL